MEFKLTGNQQRIFNTAETSFRNILVMGKPGVGKSVLIRALTENGFKHYHLAAPTGLAALNIDGKTLHSLMRLPIFKGIVPPDYNNFRVDEKVINNIRYNLKHLIIDEISMVRADMFDYINRFLKEVKGNNQPFGGVQIIAVGDFFQLPPVTMSEENVQLREAGYDSPFVFDSKVFKEGNFKVMMLDEVLRQKDPTFISILDSARIGRLTTKQCQLLNKQVGNPGDMRIKLCATNKQADQINFGNLRAIPGNSTTFYANRFGEWPALPVDEELQLKIGAQIIVKKNGADRPPKIKGDFASQVVNGTLGKVVEIEEKGLNAEPSVTIELENGNTATIYRQRWEKKIREKNMDGEWEERVVASFDQIPLALAWAISMHKSQGQSYDKVHIDPARTFAAGQMYVALSRCRTIEGISFASEVSPKHFWADQSVLSFFYNLEEEVNV